MDFTFLKDYHIRGKGGPIGKDPIELFSKIKRKAALTDFSILLGGSGSCFGEQGELDQTYGWYFTSTFSSPEHIVAINPAGDIKDIYTIFDRNFGARPVVKYSKIMPFILNISPRSNGILEVEYGEYPQDVVSKMDIDILERLHYSNLLQKTGKTYTINTNSFDKSATSVDFEKLEEYTYNDKKYVRLKVNANFKSPWTTDKLSTGEIFDYGEYVWVEVKPVKWLVDEKEDLAISEKLLFSNIPYETKKNYLRSFNSTYIKKYIDDYFSKEIIPCKVHENIVQTQEEVDKEVLQTNKYGFDYSKVTEEEIITGSIESDIAVFLHGKSSDGKSARVKQIDPDCIIIYLRNATPESLNGKSVYNSDAGKMIDIKPTWLVKLEEICKKEPDKLHILFFDEITNALPSIQGIAFNIVLDKEVNGKWKLPSNARIVAAGNEMKDSLAANQLAEPLFNRFVHVYIETTVDKWLEWANNNNIHPAIYVYIAFKREKSLRSKYNGITPNADPRKWEMASKMLYKTNKPEMIRGLVGEDITREFIAFCQQKVITLQDVLNDNYRHEDLQMNMAERYATVIGLASVDEANFIKVRKFVSKLGPELLSLFESLWSKDNPERLEKIAEVKLSRHR